MSAPTLKSSELSWNGVKALAVITMYFGICFFGNHCRCSKLIFWLKQLAGLRQPCTRLQDSSTAWPELSPRCGSKAEPGRSWEASSRFTSVKFRTLSSKCRMNCKVSKITQSKENKDNVSAGQKKMEYNRCWIAQMFLFWSNKSCWPWLLVYRVRAMMQ